MNITDAPPDRLDLGVQQLISGSSVAYHNVVFCWRHPKDSSELLVLSYSDCYYSENIRQEEANKMIARSKLVAEDLVEKSSAFRDLWDRVSKHYQFCYDYGKGAVLLAEEVDGKVVWKGQPKGEQGNASL